MVPGYLSLLYSIGERPLGYWSKQQSQSGRIRKILDSDLLENVIEIQDFEQKNGYGTSILCPPESSQLLNIKLPILVVVIKNLNLQCRLQVQVVDDENCLHHFQFSSVDTEKHNAKEVISRVKIKLETGWNKLELNLSNLTQTIFKRQYEATQRLQICGNCRLRRVYFLDKHYENDEVSPKLYHGFLDSYMLKWGVRSVENSTQTSGGKSKSKVRENDSRNDSELISKDHLDANDNSDANMNVIDTSENQPEKANEDFLRRLQIKNDMLVNDFFDRQNNKLLNVSDFKRQAKIKSYSFPLFNNRRNGICSDGTLKKIDILRNLTRSYLSTEEKSREEGTLNKVSEEWQNRYLSKRDKTVNNIDSPRRSVVLNLNKSIMKQKPKSMLLLSEMYANNGRKRLLATTKKTEALKRNESDTIIK